MLFRLLLKDTVLAEILKLSLASRTAFVKYKIHVLEDIDQIGVTARKWGPCLRAR
jgi:hypothetical protein